MFTDNISDTWDTSEFQESFIASYFGMKKAPKLKTPETLKSKNDFESADKSNDVKQRKRKSKVSSESYMSEDLLNASTNGNIEKKRKANEISQLDKCIADGENDSDLDKMDLEFPTVDSQVTKSQKKRKRKSKNKDKEVNKKEISVESLNQKSEKSLTAGSKSEDKPPMFPITHDKDPCSNSLTATNSFQSKLSQKLQAAKFRYLNEMLYTSSGKDALEYFQENTEEFQDYHEGYQSQVTKWPINPVDIIIEEIQQLNKQCVIADLGCGEAKIAETFPKRTVHSFDLIALKDSVTACDMSNVPLPTASVDVVVFCLSLMGTNWKDYLREGHRLLKLEGLLKIAEIESRIDNLKDFIKSIEAHGFSLVNKNLSHKMFVFLNFKKVKSKVKSSKVPQITLKPCLYKKR